MDDAHPSDATDEIPKGLGAMFVFGVKSAPRRLEMSSVLLQPHVDVKGETMWCRWYGTRPSALRKKRPHHCERRSIAGCGQPRTPIMLREFEKMQVGRSRAITLPR
jgi:hypothetical protein